MAVLLRHNLDSAFAITRYDSAGFVRAFGVKLGGADKAAAIHARARQIFATTLSVTVGVPGRPGRPGLGRPACLSSSATRRSSRRRRYPVTAYPTLEDLFGSLDYCNCSDCGSILSPAAYLVDLLNYIDQPAPSGGLANPQDVLLARRPDLQYLPLTCANTNTALPYIDIVNETLEYFVANGLSLAGYQGHDTGDDDHVGRAGRRARSTSTTPPTGSCRAPSSRRRCRSTGRSSCCGCTWPSLGVALPGRDDDAAGQRRSGRLGRRPPATAGPTSCIEQLTISRDEYRLFTDPALQLGDLYGLPVIRHRCWHLQTYRACRTSPAASASPTTTW